MMENEPIQPGKPVIPPPDLPPPPPAEKPPTPPPLKVRVHEAGEDGRDGPEDGGAAPLNTRVFAVLIDTVVAAGLVMAAVLVLPQFAERIGWLAGFGYLVTRDSLPFLPGGQGVGKKAMKLRAVTRDGAPLTGNWEAALIRNGVLLIPFFPLIELFVLLSREDKPGHGLRLGDEWAKTRVIVEPPKPVAADEDGE